MKRNAEGNRASIALSDEAIDWLVRLQSGQATDKDRSDWLHWRNQSEAHEMAAVEAETIWHGIGIAAPDYRQKERTRSVTRRAVIGGGLAVIGCGFLLPSDFLFADHVTPVGGRKTVTLEDGSTILMNADTAISVDFSGHLRQLTLHKGQAQFSVFHDPARPFIVSANGGYVRALGTVYDVDIRSGGVVVTTLEGSVEVTTKTRASGSVQADAGYSVHYDNKGSISSASAVDVEAETAWQRGKIIFNRRPMSDVAEELQRYRQGRIVIVSSSLRALEVSGVFDMADPDSVLNTIEETLGVSVIRMPFVTIIR